MYRDATVFGGTGHVGDPGVRTEQATCSCDPEAMQQSPSPQLSHYGISWVGPSPSYVVPRWESHVWRGQGGSGQHIRGTSSDLESADLGWGCWCAGWRMLRLVIPALGKERQEEQDFKVILSYHGEFKISLRLHETMFPKKSKPREHCSTNHPQHAASPLTHGDRPGSRCLACQAGKGYALALNERLSRELGAGFAMLSGLWACQVICYTCEINSLAPALILSKGS